MPGEEWNGDWRCQAINLDEEWCQQAIGTFKFIFHVFNQIVQGVSATRCQSLSLVNPLHPIHAVVRALAFVRESVWTCLPATIPP